MGEMRSLFDEMLKKNKKQFDEMEGMIRKLLDMGRDNSDMIRGLAARNNLLVGMVELQKERIEELKDRIGELEGS